ncbi:MAG: hypothetical protein BroJett021_42270 [Chloroflexota bacterium]|jgi:hypothetical protein|nr:hypothetical protein [Caldilinea sp.]GIK75239.1 MAG: hypothetical protein BroJett021_42270 [Chloroflexota bacterium]
MSRPAKYIPYYDDIIEAMATPGCAFCKLQQRAAERYLDAFLWESVNDPRLRREVSAARGFCNDHAWLLVRPGAALSAAIIYKDVVTGTAQLVKAAATGAGDGSFWQRVRAWLGRSQPADDPVVRALVPQRLCPVCTNAAEVEEHLCATVLSAMKQSGDFLTHYRSSSGLCVRHFSALIAHSRQPQQRTALIDAQLAIWQSLEGELSEFIRKNNHRFRGEKFGDERDSWERAIALTSGPQPASTSSRGGLTQTG